MPASADSPVPFPPPATTEGVTNEDVTNEDVTNEGAPGPSPLGTGEDDSTTLNSS